MACKIGVFLLQPTYYVKILISATSSALLTVASLLNMGAT